MPKLYFLHRSFCANTAPSNRALAYLRGLSELEITTYVIFLMTDSKCDKIEHKWENIHIEYYWERWFYINRKGFRLLFYFLNVLRFWLLLKEGDVVYLYDMPEVLHLILKKRGIKVYHEMTEHPTVKTLGVRFYKLSVDTYLKDCSKLDGLIVISTALEKFFVDNGVPKERIHIVNMMVDSTRFEGISKETNIESYIAYCGTVLNEKDGVDYLIEAFSIVYRNYPHIKLYIMGSIPKVKDEMKLQKIIQDLHLEGAVIFKGVVSTNDMPQMLANAIAVALARPNNIQAQYGFPTKLGEYLLSGTPTVVTGVGDIPLILTNKKDALIASPSDSKDFAQKLLWLIEHPKEAICIAKNSRTLVNLKFNYLIETKKWVRIVCCNS